MRNFRDFGGCSHYHTGLPPTRYSTRAWIAVAEQGPVATASTTVLWNWSLKQVPASQAGIFVNLEVLVGAILGVSLLPEVLGRMALGRCMDYRGSFISTTSREQQLSSRKTFVGTPIMGRLAAIFLPFYIPLKKVRGDASAVGHSGLSLVAVCCCVSPPFPVKPGGHDDYGGVADFTYKTQAARRKCSPFSSHLRNYQWKRRAADRSLNGWSS
jgi:EamA-like transporter family